jgi:hypothetical protein
MPIPPCRTGEREDDRRPCPAPAGAEHDGIRTAGIFGYMAVALRRPRPSVRPGDALAAPVAAVAAAPLQKM